MRESTKILLAVCAVFLGATVIVVVCGKYVRQDNINSAVERVAEDPSSTPKPGLVDLITIDNPFNARSDPMMKLVTVDDGKFSVLVSYTDYHVTTSEFKLPSDFTDVGAQFTTMTSEQPIAISQRLTFDNDSVITWPSQPDDTGLYTWETHPDHIFVNRGDTVVVSYTSTDGGVHWLGSVTTQDNPEKPQN